MVKYVGIRNNKIVTVSDSPFKSQGMDVVESNVVNPSEICAAKIEKKSLKDMKVAFVGNWKMICGISTYSEKLWPELAKHLGNIRLFIERNPDPTGNVLSFGERLLSEDDVVECWKRGEPTSDLVQKLKEYDPDIVFIQHEFGLWPNARYWMSLVNQMFSKRVIVTMHSVFHHRDKTICEAVIPEIVVHLEGAKEVLVSEKKVSGKVTVIPHGCDQQNDKTKLWNLYRSPRTFIQIGFGFHYKGWETSLRAVSVLKKKYPDVFFTGIFSESPYNKVLHEVYYQDLMKIVDELSLQENVALIRGFQSDEVLDSFLRTNQVAVFPYISTEQHEVFGASGAARMAMSKGIPVITSRVNHFSDLPSVKASDENELAEELEKLFNDWKAKKKQIELQTQFIEENSWSEAAKQYIDLFRINTLDEE